MYTFVFRGNLDEELKRTCLDFPSITNRLEEMESNPLSKAKKTGIPVIGKYFSVFLYIITYQSTAALTYERLNFAAHAKKRKPMKKRVH